MCRDFLRLGYSRMVVDPGVRLAYTADVARQRYTQKVPCSALIMHKSIKPQAGGAHGDMQVQSCCTASPHLCKAGGSRQLSKGIASGMCSSCDTGRKGFWW